MYIYIFLNKYPKTAKKALFYKKMPPKSVNYTVFCPKLSSFILKTYRKSLKKT